MSRIALTSFVVALLAGAVAPAAAQQLPDLRIPQQLPFDAEVATNVWADAYVGYRTYGDSSVTAEAEDLYLHADFAFELLKNLELGGSIELISRDFDNEAIGSESGPGDLFAWGKYQFYRSGNKAFNAGAFLSLPTGDDDKGLGTGNVEPGVFVSGGLHSGAGALFQGYLGLRQNGDFDGPGDPEGDSDEGQTSVLLGIGAATDVNPDLVAFASFDFESERYDDGEAFSQLSVGARWRLSGPWKLQGLAGLGISDAAPDFYLGAGVVYAP